MPALSATLKKPLKGIDYRARIERLLDKGRIGELLRQAFSAVSGDQYKRLSAIGEGGGDPVDAVPTEIGIDQRGVEISL
jgi:hypothetical protein